MKGVIAAVLVVGLCGCGAASHAHRRARTGRGATEVALPTAKAAPARPGKPEARQKRRRSHTPFSPTATLVAHGPRSGHEVALTFDADMTQAMLAAVRGGQSSIGYDPRIVDELRSSHTPATIFMTGLWPTAHPDAARDLASDPLFEIENHTFDHSSFAHPCYGLPGVPSTAAKAEEVERAADAIEGLTGSAPRYFRFPGGCHGDGDLKLVAGLGEQPVQWDVISGDAYEHDPATVARQTLAGVKPGSIVVMHLVGAPNAPATADALRTVLPGLRERGLHPVRLRQLLSQ